ncbi:MAG: hypothetical protein KGN02_10820 [bacterium]|nr:hypothetical protein [bacterium]
MFVRYRAEVVLPSLALALGLAAHPGARHPACAPAPSLYSARALRRARLLLQLRLLELREERLERVREVILHRIPLDALFTPEPKLPEPTPGTRERYPKQNERAGTTYCR